MSPDERLSVLDRPVASDDKEYWMEVGTHILGILDSAQVMTFIKWVVCDSRRTSSYMCSEQTRVNLLLEFQALVK